MNPYLYLYIIFTDSHIESYYGLIGISSIIENISSIVYGKKPSALVKHKPVSESGFICVINPSC